MARLNIPPTPIYTHEGARAARINSELQLRRSIMSCLLWENEFYEDGVEIAARIADLIPKVKPDVVAAMAIEAREKSKLRHIPLFIVCEMAKLPSHKVLVAKTLEQIIQRVDELTEYLAIYWKGGRCPVSAQSKRGLAKAFLKFNEYELAKYNRGNEIKLRDALFLCHAKPKDKEQDELWKRLIDNKLAVPDTWEVTLSAKDDLSKKEKWERLLREKKLGALALLRNLRNMETEKVDQALIKESILSMKTERVLPFRFIAAAGYAPRLEPYLEQSMMKCLENFEKLLGKTFLVVDVSGSMGDQISGKSEISRMDAACGLAILARELCENIDIYSFSSDIKQIPPRHGFALRDAIVRSQSHSSTNLGTALDLVYQNATAENRIIIITDEQSHQDIRQPICQGYLINVASAKNGIGYGKWIHIDGWSESVFDYIREYEKIATQ